MIQLALLSLKTGLDISQTLSICELSESHAEIVVEAGEFLDLEIALIAIHTFVEDVERKMLHHLREDNFSGVHSSALRAVVHAAD